MFWSIELLVQFGVIETELGLFVVNLGVLQTGVHHIYHTLQGLRTRGLNQFEHLLITNQIGEGDQQLARLCTYLLIGVLNEAQYPCYCFLVGKFLLGVAF